MVVAQILLIDIWLFATYTMAVYLHSPFEKITGYPAFPFFILMCVDLTNDLVDL